MAKILVADDNSNIQKMVGLALKDQGIDVVAVGNGEAAVRKISDIRPDLVLADVFMPVRNGYEVCRYVKDNSTLSHIPVILLVGAFDPLDEQEAQRVGADGVLKKPFVPPDPLISMVKSALMRASVPLGPAAATERAQEAPKRPVTEIMSGGANAMPASIAPEKLPEIMPEPMEEFPTPAPRLKIASGNEPLAFGSLLDTPETDDAAIASKPMINLAADRKWDEEPDEVEEEKDEEEETSQGGWRPGGMEEAAESAGEPASGVKDWRDEAFHGDSPAKSFTSSHWAPAIEQPSFAEAAESQSVAVATELTKPSENPSPFSGDAWATEMATGVEEKIAAMKEVAPVAPEAETPADAAVQPLGQSTETEAPAQDPAAPVVAELAPAVERAKAEFAGETANWSAVPESAWEEEAKKASLLASTWDVARPPAPEETQEVSAYSAESHVEHAESQVEYPTESATEASAYSAESHVEHAETPAEVPSEPPTSSSEVVASGEQAEHVEAPVNERAASPASEVVESKSWENTWEAPTPHSTEAVAEETHAGAPQIEQQPSIEAAPEPAVAEPAAPEPSATVAHAAEPDMDELVARVLGKMNPEVLQRVTREILKPVIEAIIRDEIDSKKS